MNLVGMRRQGLTRDEIEVVRWVYKTLNRRGLSVPSAVEAIRERHASESSRVLDRMVEFLDRSERSICTAFQQRARTGYDVRS
jgi:acyl-[acyl carrier protein]--UDP-N-acetylglucosamine O-acyltransferase